MPDQKHSIPCARYPGELTDSLVSYSLLAPALSQRPLTDPVQELSWRCTRCHAHRPAQRGPQGGEAAPDGLPRPDRPNLSLTGCSNLNRSDLKWGLAFGASPLDAATTIRVAAGKESTERVASRTIPIALTLVATGAAAGRCIAQELVMRRAMGRLQGGRRRDGSNHRHQKCQRGPLSELA